MTLPYGVGLITVSKLVAMGVKPVVAKEMVVRALVREVRVTTDNVQELGRYDIRNNTSSFFFRCTFRLVSFLHTKSVR